MPTKSLLLSMLMLLAGTGCQSPLRSNTPLSLATTLTLEVTPLDNGEFALTGTTSLPDNTQLTALALRHWVPAETVASDVAPPRDLSAQTAAGDVTPRQQPLYSVLDYQPVTVANGQWSTQLKLWQAAADGRYQEPWQAQAESLKLNPLPYDTVQFAITLAPDRLGAALDHVAGQARQSRVAEVLRVTAHGEPFLWADQTRPVGLPQGQTTPPDDLLARTNGGWGDRHLLVPEPPLPYTLTPAGQRQTTAPLTVGEMLQ